MPRTKGIPSYGLHRATGQARVRIDGKDVYLGPHGSEESKRQYEQIVRKLITDRARAEVKARVEIATDLTVNELAARYLQHARGYYVKGGLPTREYGNICDAIRAVRERHGFELVTAFGPLKMKGVREQWVADGIVRTQINSRVGRVRRMFAWGVEEELVPPAVLQALKAIKGLKKGRTEAREGKKVLPVADADVAAVLPHVSRQVAAMIRVQQCSGARPAEVCLMRTIDIDTSDPACWAYRPHRHKTDHHEHRPDRTIFLGPRAIEALQPWLRLNVSEYLFQPREAMAELSARRRANRRTKVQPSQQDRRKTKPKRVPGQRYTTISYGHAIADACDRAGVPRWSPNQLRHSVGTLVRKEYDLETAKAVLGHSSVIPTQVYAERDEEAARTAMAKLG